MIYPEEIYRYVGRDAYDMVREFNEDEQRRHEALMSLRARLCALEEACDE